MPLPTPHPSARTRYWSRVRVLRGNASTVFRRRGLQGRLSLKVLKGQDLKVSALLDSDEEGLKAQKQLVHNWLLADGDVHDIGDDS
jgi:hypothetical protein